jgi:hypothetical protein
MNDEKDLEEMCFALWELYIEANEKVDRLRENLRMRDER